MNTITERRWINRDKSEWGAGEWQNEPDKLQWVDAASGLDCLMVRGPHGGWCGYVGVPEGHPCFARDYDKCYLPCGHDHSAEEEWFYCEDRYLDVHGGLTFSDFCQEGAPEGHGICHVPYEGRPDRVWWLGFDCAHSGDFSPAYAKRSRAFFAMEHESYKTEAYVRGEVTKLAGQLAAVQ